MSGNNDAVILNEPTDGAPDKASGKNVETLNHKSFLYAHHRLNFFNFFFVISCMGFLFFNYYFIKKKMRTCGNEGSISKA